MSPIRLSIIVPVYNEEATLRAISKRIVDSCGEFAEVIYVDDGSSDGSLAILHDVARDTDTVISKENGGKGSAVRRGYDIAKGEYVIVQDADLEYDPEEIPSLLEYAEAHHLPVLYGSRRLKKQKQYAHVLYYVGGTALTYVFNLLFWTSLTDQPTCYKMVKGDILRRILLTEDDFRFDAELTAILARLSYPIAELPISYHPRSMDEGKKINWTDWLKAVWVFVYVRFSAKSSLLQE